MTKKMSDNASDKTRRTPTPRLFTQAVLQKMGECAQAPLVFALSRPENIAECTAKEAYDATGGRCVFAGGCQVEPFVHAGRGVEIRASTSAYVFPGFAYGLTLADAHRVRTPMWLEAAEAVASMVTEEDLGKGAVYPRMAKIREVSAMVAARGRDEVPRDGRRLDPGQAPVLGQDARGRQAVDVQPRVQVLHVTLARAAAKLVSSDCIG